MNRSPLFIWNTVSICSPDCLFPPKQHTLNHHPLARANPVSCRQRVKAPFLAAWEAPRRLTVNRGILLNQTAAARDDAVTPQPFNQQLKVAGLTAPHLKMRSASSFPTDQSLQKTGCKLLPRSFAESWEGFFLFLFFPVFFFFFLVSVLFFSFLHDF